MKIESVRIENFRSFEDETVPFNDYTCLVGPNGAGKSTVLMALNVFFRETENLQTDVKQLTEADFHRRNTANPIQITVTFTDLSQEAKEDFSHYVRQDKLAVTAVATFDPTTGIANVEQQGKRLGMKAFIPFFKDASNGIAVAELRNTYASIREIHAELPQASTKPAMTQALQAYEESRPEECELIPSKAQFYGVSKGANRLAKHVQWVYVPAVKDATSEQVEAKNSALGKLLERTVRARTNFEVKIENLYNELQKRYQQLLDENQDVLQDLSDTLQSRISEWAHPDARLRLEWKQDPGKSVRVEEPSAHILAGEGEFEGELARFGHGLQRSYLLVLLQELAGSDDADDPTLILACEEPELYQHPPQARHLASVLDSLRKGNSQVIISTHDPHFVTGQGFEDVRMVRKDSTNQKSVISHMSFEEMSQAVAYATGNPLPKPAGILAKIHQALQPSLNEMFFTRRLILVEGLEDVAYILTYLNLMEKTAEFRRLGCHIVPVNGKSELLQPLLIARHMKIPTYVICDADSDKEDRGGSKSKHEADNRHILKVLGIDSANPMPNQTISDIGLTMWNSDIGTIVKTEIGEQDWETYCQLADNQYGHAGKLHKNSLHIGATLNFAWEDQKRAPSLELLCTSILDSYSYSM